MLVQYLKYNHTKYYLKALYGQWDIRWMLNETRTSFRHSSRNKKKMCLKMSHCLQTICHGKQHNGSSNNNQQCVDVPKVTWELLI